MVVNDIASIMQTKDGKVAIVPKAENTSASRIFFTTEELTMMLALYSSIYREKPI